jgi:tRNA (guanine-N7-)-methyltransferase
VRSKILAFEMRSKGNRRAPDKNRAATRGGNLGIRGDLEGGPPFPGRVLEKQLWTRTRASLGSPGERFDWKRWFGREAPRVVDLGCGNGRFLVASALARPGVDHLGVELVPPAVRLGSLRAGQRGLTNCKIAWGDATEFICERCEPASLDEVHLYHPQPHYDANNKSRRQLAPAALLAIHRALNLGGLFVFQTDNPAYADYARATIPLLFTFRELDGPWPDAPQGRTLRELVAKQRGLPITRVEARRLDLSDAEAASRTAAMPAPEFDARRENYRENDNEIEEPGRR